MHYICNCTHMQLDVLMLKDITPWQIPVRMMGLIYKDNRQTVIIHCKAT